MDGNFAASVNDIGGKLPPVSTTLAVNLPPVADYLHFRVNLKVKIIFC
jgi:hypothetical protein